MDKLVDVANVAQRLRDLQYLDLKEVEIKSLDFNVLDLDALNIKSLELAHLVQVKSPILSMLKLSGFVDVTFISQLTQGLSQLSFYVRGSHEKVAGKEWVLRVNQHNSITRKNRAFEVAYWQQAANAGLAPKLVFVSDNLDWYVSQFCVSEAVKSKTHLSLKSVSDEIKSQCPKNRKYWGDALDRLSMMGCDQPCEAIAFIDGAEVLLLSLLKGLQQLSVQKSSVKLQTAQLEITNDSQWHTYRHMLQTGSTKLSSWHDTAPKKAAESIATWQTKYAQIMSLKPKIDDWLKQLAACMTSLQYCHRDLNPQNILYTQATQVSMPPQAAQLVCIDFEYACHSHPLFDLATVLATHHLSASQQDTLINQYLHQHPNLTSNALTAVPAAMSIYWVFSCSWALLMALTEIESTLSDTDVILSQQGGKPNMTVLIKLILHQALI